MADRFHDLAPLSYTDADNVIRTGCTDILLDMQGHTLGSRTEILAGRPGSIQARSRILLFPSLFLILWTVSISILLSLSLLHHLYLTHTLSL